MLSDAQFAGKVLSGGASRRIDDKTEAPKSGYYVSTPTSEHTTPVGEFGAAQVTEHHAGLAGQAGYQGGWNNADDGKVYLDRSVRVHSRALGMSLGKQWNQLAIYHATPGTKEEYPSPATSTWPTREQAGVKK